MPVNNKKYKTRLPECYCLRGDETKAAIVQDFIIHPIAHLKLIPGQNKTSYSGYPLTDQYYCFTFEQRTNKEETGVFFCGEDVAKDFIELINGKELPLFNPLKSGTAYDGSRFDSSSAGHVTRNKPNANKKLFLDAVMLLMSLWDSTNKGQTALASILQLAIDEGIETPPTFQQVLSVNTMLGGTNNTLTGLLAKERAKYPDVSFRDFDFSPLNEIVKRSKYYNKHPPCY